MVPRFFDEWPNTRTSTRSTNENICLSTFFRTTSSKAENLTLCKPCATWAKTRGHNKPQSAVKENSRPRLTGVGCVRAQIPEASGACCRKAVKVQILSSAPFFSGGDPCTPPGSLRSARTPLLAPLRSRLASSVRVARSLRSLASSVRRFGSLRFARSSNIYRPSPIVQRPSNLEPRISNLEPCHDPCRISRSCQPSIAVHSRNTFDVRRSGQFSSV